ncbi:MAG TPA: radical SAM protein [Solirubrobacterales bacterium]|nr:radical SAM protein [Solirubrobacterales bacterium]
MNVTFIYPEVPDLGRLGSGRREFPPFGVLYLAAVAEAAGHDVSVIPARSETDGFDLTGSNFVGYSVASSATFSLLSTVHRRSTYGDDTLVMVGGVHVNLYPEQSLRDFPSKFAGVGPCEESLEQILQASDNHRHLAALPNVAWLDADGAYQPGVPANEAPLDQLPFPARHLLPDDRVVMTDRLAGTDLRMAHVLFSRGCPFKCKYCAVAGSRIHYQAAVRARDELIDLTNRTAIDGFAIVDDNFIVNRHRVAEIAREIQPLGLRWSALSRVDTVREDLVGTLADAGCIELKFGIESGSETLLRAMGKRTTVRQISDAVSWAAAAGIGVKAFLIHGFPGESRATTRETIRLLDSLGNQIERLSLFRFVPLPGTEVYERWTDYDVHGTHLAPDWDGNWAKFHIHHNHYHWWGGADQFAELQAAYTELAQYVTERWPDAAPQ